MASALIPFNIPLSLHEVSVIKTLCNGNCLFNSVSFLLSNSYRLSPVLRLLTAAELFLNGDQYSNHPMLQLAYDCPEITYERKNIFAILLREEAGNSSDHIQAIQQEAALTCNNRKWSGMVDILGLSSVIKKRIWSVYPDCNYNIRPVISGVVEPLSCNIPPTDLENTIFIMWSRDGDFDSTPGQPFEPNHFAPIVYKPACPDELHQSYDEPPIKKMRKIKRCSFYLINCSFHQLIKLGMNIHLISTMCVIKIINNHENILIILIFFNDTLVEDTSYTKHTEKETNYNIQETEDDFHSNGEETEDQETEEDFESNGEETENAVNCEQSQILNLTEEERYQNDLGHILTHTMTPQECVNAVSSMSDAQKYHLVKHHVKTSTNQIFPSTYLHQCFRSFKPMMIERYPWAVYSPCLDGIFCLHCSLFCKNRENKFNFVNTPFTQWHKIKEKLNEHANARYHHDSLIDSANFVTKHEQPEKTIALRLNEEKRKRCKENRHILKIIAKDILFCGRQNIALRGDVEDIKDSSKNPGNFLALLKVLGESDEILQQHLENPRAKNTTYLSPRIQNEFISIIGCMIQQSIIKEVQKAKFYAIMADEVESHNKEILPLCIRFVDEHKVIREEFLEFVMLERITGKHIAGEILSSLGAMNIDVSLMRGQSYDGASNMSSQSVGVQKRIRDHAPLAAYTHCCGHILNLVIVHSCKLPTIRNVIDKMKSVFLFFNNSPKKEGLLKAVISTEIPDAKARKPLLNLCVTRWVARHESYRHFYQAFVYMVKAFEVIAYGMYREVEKLQMYKDWDNESKRDATELLQCITSFDFIISFITLYMTLAQLDGISKSLQEKELDILGAHQKITKVQDDYEVMRQNISEIFRKWFQQAVRMAEKVGETPILPRIAKRQEHRSNTPVDSCQTCEKQPCEHRVLQYYERNVAVPFVDHINMELKERFSEFSVRCSSLIGLVPSVFKSQGHDSSFEDVVEMYKEDLPSAETFNTELIIWKQIFANDLSPPSTLRDTLKLCDRDRFPNIFVLLQIECTLPITSCSCERGASSLKPLRTYMRASMTEGRLTGLALMHIHYAKPVNLDQVVEDFANKHPRKMELKSIIYDY